MTRQEGSLLEDDPPALHRLVALEERLVDAAPPRPAPLRRSSPRPERARAPARAGGRGMGYQPGLDGLRALSVLAVIAYHAGFSWMHGGFFGVEVFFVVSGFLITSLLIDERSGTGAVALGRFWLRRARRLLPALAMVLVAVAVWALVAGSAQQTGQLRRDLPWSIFYLGNWGQIVGGVPYYAADPPLLRHLWSLAVEEQWYLIWPLVFVALSRTRWSRERTAAVLGAVALASMAFTWWLHANGPGPVRGPIGWLDGVDRVNLMYLWTPTRASGLLLGAAAAFVWRPWTVRPGAADAAAARRVGSALDVVGAAAIAALGCIAAVAVLTEGYVYQWLLPLVSVLSLVAVMAVVHPAAVGFRRVLGWRPLVEVGKRSYGVYLWHWPIFVFLGAIHGSVWRVAVALGVTALVAEICYRAVEVPVRRGSLGRWWRNDRERAVQGLAAAAAAVGALVIAYGAVAPYDAAVGGEDATFALEPSPAAGATADPAATPAPTVSVPAAGTAAPTGPPAVPITILGDSQAHSLAINLPDGVEGTFDVADGSLPGCSVYDHGRAYSSVTSFDNFFAVCEGWQQDWADAVSSHGADVAVVLLGAWDVFDLDDDGSRLVFATPAWDAYFTENLRSGIEAVAGVGAEVALVEVACMRPQQVEGAAVPVLPERGDDTRVAHLNDLLREVAAASPASASFVEGPDEWCADGPISTDLAYRWDGVHVYKPGAALIYETIAPSVLALAG